jgi:hypothetical protein
MHRLFVTAAALAVATTALAQAPAAAPLRFMGVITALSPTSLTIKLADGTSTVLILAPTLTVMKAHPIDIDAIKPGTYVATANTNIDANSGRSIELRMYGPNAGDNAFSRPMAQPNTTMTNGTVQTVTKGAGGRELDVAYPGGVRHLVAPPNVQVIGNVPATSADLSVGETVSAVAAAAPSGPPIGTRITINVS